MKNFRIPVMGLATCALLFTSCAKTITKQEAIDFVKANYTSTEKKTPTKVSGEFSGRGANDASKDAVVAMGVEMGFDVSREKLSDKKDNLTSLVRPYSVLTSEEIQNYPEDGTEFKIKGKELTIVMKPIEVMGMTTSGTTVYTSEGYPNNGSAEYSLKQDDIDYSITVNLTYTY